MARLTVTPLSTNLTEELSRATVDENEISIYWLGQAGFVVRTAGLLLLIDPYLSDCLAGKYRGSEFSHERMMRAPIESQAFPRVDLVFCTHRHSDHMDPVALPGIARGNPECTVVVPATELAHARSLGIDARQLRGVVAGERAAFAGRSGERSVQSIGVTVEAIPSAHEELSVNERGESPYLGYLITGNGLSLYHSGDCVPYDGLPERLREHRIDVALLPINGRSASLRERGIAGNFTLEEAIELCDRAQIPTLVGHHFGMFSFNTLSREAAVRTIAAYNGSVRCLLADVDRRWRLHG